MRLTFSLYGFIIGLAIVIGSWLIENEIKNEQLLRTAYTKIVALAFIFAIIGARAWHVGTDFYIYQDDLLATVAIWHGGLSIFGGILGGLVGLLLSVFVLNEFKKMPWSRKRIELLKMFDYAVFGFPVGQAIGRWANYFNQELYGLPYRGFLKIFIDPEHRLVGFEHIG